MFTLLLCSSAMALDVGVLPSTRKLLATDAVPDEQEVVLAAAMGEWEGFQVVVGGAAEGVEVELSDLEGPGTIPAEAAVLYREHFFDIVETSAGGVTYHEREPGLYPDPLIPFVDPWSGEAVGAPFDVDSGEIGIVWVDLEVPRDADPGEYTGTVKVTAGGESVELPLTLEVWAFELPAERSVATSYGFSWNHMKYYHGGPEADDESVEYIMDRYYEAMHQHRIDPTTVSASVDYNFDKEGNLEDIDWSEYDAWVGPWLDGSRFEDGQGVTRFNVSAFRPGGGTGSYTEDEYQQAACAFAEHLDEQGWWDKAWVYATDEPWLNGGDETYEQIHEDVERLVEASPLWEGKTLVTSPYDDRVEGDVGIWCPVTPMYEEWFYAPGTYATRDIYEDRIAQGDELWFYVCNANFPPYAGYDIDTRIGYEPRIAKWGAWYEGATGFLFWRVNYWFDYDPWNSWANVDQFTALFARNGDGVLLYPGDHDGTAGGTGSPEDVSMDGPVVSYRLKQIRDGLEDWEMFLIATDLGAGDYARAQVERAYTRFGDFLTEDCDGPDFYYCPDDQPWTLEEEVLLDVRANIAAKINFIIDPDTYPDPEATEDTGETDVPEDGKGDDKECGCSAAGGAVAWLALPLLVARRRG